MTNYTSKIIAAAIGTIVSLALAACTEPENQGLESEEIVPDGPVALEILVDVSGSNADEQRRELYLRAASQAIRAVAERGGRVTVRAFFGDVHSAELLDAPVPTPDEAAGVQRAQQVLPVRDGAQEVIAQALGLEPQRPEVQAALADLTPGRTDVAGNLGQAVEKVGEFPNAAVVQITDGLDYRLPGLGQVSAETLAERLGAVLPKANQNVAVAIVGVGASKQAKDTEETSVLSAAWGRACTQMGATCLVSPQIDVDGFIH